MKEWIDYYSIMQVHQHAEYDVIENTYKKLCRKYHPDINRDPDAEKKMTMINIAYSVLRDEKKRNQYYQEWLRHYNTPVRPVVYSRAAAKHAPQPNAPRHSDEARQVITQYFECLSAGLYDDAYNVLSDLDKQCITREQFCQWQRRVGGVYKIHQFYVQNCKNYDAFTLRDNTACPAKRFMMSLNEEIIRTAKRTKYSLYKFVIYENKQWKVYLGYTDVIAFTQQFDFPKEWGKHGDEETERMTNRMRGIIDKDLFLHQAEVEVNRFRRYKRNFVIGAIQLRLDGQNNVKLNESLTVFTGQFFISRLRKMDAMCYIGGSRFCVLMAETTLSEAYGAIERISKNIRRDILAKYHVNSETKTELREYGSGSVSQLLESCIAAIEAQNYGK